MKYLIDLIYFLFYICSQHAVANPEALSEYVNALFRQDMRISDLGDSTGLPIKDEFKLQEALSENPLLIIIKQQGRFTSSGTPKTRVSWQPYKDCLFIQKKMRGHSKPKRFYLVPGGLPELRFDCVDVCIKPTVNFTVEWFFKTHYGASEIPAARMENAIVFNNGGSLFLKWLNPKVTGVFYCKYDSLVYFEYWVHVEPLEKLTKQRGEPPKGNYTGNRTLTDENKIIPFDNYGIKVSHIFEQWSNCSHLPYGRSFLKNFKRWLKLNVLSINEKFETRFRGCKIKLDFDASPTVKADFTKEYEIFNLFEGHWLPCKSPFLPDFFIDLLAKHIHNHTEVFDSLIQERYCEFQCSSVTNLTAVYTETHVRSSSESEAHFTCSGAKKKDRVTWTKDGHHYTMDDDSISSLNPEDEGKYTCWVKDVPLSSTIISLKISHLQISGYVVSLFEKLLAYIESFKE